MAVKLHFTKESYDVFTSGGRVKGTRDSFNSRNDRYLFEKLAKKFNNDKDLIQYYVSNFAYGNEDVVYSNEDSTENYSIWIKRKQSITKVFDDETSKIILYCESNKLGKDRIFDFTSGEYPVILSLYFGKFIGIETVSILDSYMNLIDSWVKHSGILIPWGSEILRIRKAKGFLKYNKQKMDIVFNKFMSEVEDLNG